MSMNLIELEELIRQLIGEQAVNISSPWGELVIEIKSSALLDVMSILKENPHCPFRMLVDICGVDYLGKKSPRFEVIYLMLSLHQNIRIQIIVPVEEGESLPSVISLFSSANWYERETWDMYGISFCDHPNLTRILTDYTFEGHPLRKDFPLSGYVQVRYDEAQKEVIYEPVSLPQAYRSFDTLSPWEGMKI